MKKPRILLTYMLRNSFVRRDIESLQQLGYRVDEWQAYPHKGLGFVANRLKECFLGSFKVARATHVVSWFSDYHSFFLLLWARLMGKPALVIVGGFDAVAAPHLQYGALLKANFRRWCIRQNYRLATQIWVVDTSLAKGCPIARDQQGVLSGLLPWMPELAPKIQTVPTGYDADFWKPQGPKTPNTVLTVGLFTDLRVAERKGIPHFLKLARLWPDFQFTIVGDADQILSKHYEIPENVAIKGLVDEASLLALFQAQEYYAQFSIIEGLPNVLCEAMLCGCIPIGNPVFGIPTAIGSTGMLMDVREMDSQAQRLKEQLAPLQSDPPRARMAQLFTKKKRDTKLKNFIELK